MMQRTGILSTSIVILGFLCVTSFSLGGLMTMLRGHVEPEVRVQMARDIFICILGFCLVTSILFILRRLPSCSQPVNSYKVNIKTGKFTRLQFMSGGCSGRRV